MTKQSKADNVSTTDGLGVIVQNSTAPAEATTPRTKTLKRCQCGASVFQGPYQRGEIVNGDFVVRETTVQCVNCHSVKPVADLEDFVIDLS